jgi:DNA invertase Pin-like site-specific DNA recombinase
MKSGLTSDRVRCAIYTRVSTDQGLDQDFNSLDAQYEAASAYIKPSPCRVDPSSFQI